jgi:transposase
MMGTKARHFAPLIHVSVEELLPQDHFYRHLERTLDLSFVGEFVHETYAGGGRPSIDPVVFFKLQLVMFFEGIRSERQLMRHAADRLSVLWFLGYDLGESLLDKISNVYLKNGVGDGGLSQRKPFLPSFWLLMDGLSLITCVLAQLPL